MACGAGLVLACHPMLLSGLARVQADPGDARLNNYLLEHESRWLAGIPGQTLWDPPFYYPVPNVAAFGDVQVAVTPLYAIWRGLGLLPDTAFQLWFLTVLVLNFVAAYILSRRLFTLDRLAAAAGAFLFAFGASRINQVGHYQLMAHFYGVLAVYALARAFGGPQGGTADRAAPAWLLVFGVSATAQLYTGFYGGWFLALSMAVALGWALALPRFRRPLLARLGGHPLAVMGVLVLVGLLLLPSWTHYRAAVDVVGHRDLDESARSLPSWRSWLYLGPYSWLYRWQFHLDALRPPGQDQEQRLGVGLLTSVVAIVGLVRHRRHAAIRLAGLVSLTLVLALTAWPLGQHVWDLLHRVVPGAAAIRAPSRVGMLLLLPVSWGVAWLVEDVRRAGQRAVLALLLVACALEQGQTAPSYDKHPIRVDVATLAARIDPGCEAFLFTPADPPPRTRGRMGFRYAKHQLDAMWAQVERGVPTLNGFSGNAPPTWPFADLFVRDAADATRLARGLDAWAETWRLDRARLCWLRHPVDWTWADDGDTLGRELDRRWGIDEWRGVRAGRALYQRARTLVHRLNTALGGRPPAP